ncbi:putative lipoprotein, partial [Mycolicibacterium hassiacum DSM 44199]
MLQVAGGAGLAAVGLGACTSTPRPVMRPGTRH